MLSNIKSTWCSPFPALSLVTELVEPLAVLASLWIARGPAWLYTGTSVDPEILDPIIWDLGYDSTGIFLGAEY